MIIMTTIHTWYPLMDQNFFVCLVEDSISRKKTHLKNNLAVLRNIFELAGERIGKIDN